jgi:hypothetical protein
MKVGLSCFEAAVEDAAPPRADVIIDVEDLGMAIQTEVAERAWDDFAKR